MSLSVDNHEAMKQLLGATAISPQENQMERNYLPLLKYNFGQNALDKLDWWNYDAFR